MNMTSFRKKGGRRASLAFTEARPLSLAGVSAARKLEVVKAVLENPRIIIAIDYVATETTNVRVVSG